MSSSPWCQDWACLVGCGCSSVLSRWALPHHKLFSTSHLVRNETFKTILVGISIQVTDTYKLIYYPEVGRGAWAAGPGTLISPKEPMKWWRNKDWTPESWGISSIPWLKEWDALGLFIRKGKLSLKLEERNVSEIFCNRTSSHLYSKAAFGNRSSHYILFSPKYPVESYLVFYQRLLVFCLEIGRLPHIPPGKQKQLVVWNKIISTKTKLLLLYQFPYENW